MDDDDGRRKLIHTKQQLTNRFHIASHIISSATTQPQINSQTEINFEIDFLAKNAAVTLLSCQNNIFWMVNEILVLWGSSKAFENSINLIPFKFVYYLQNSLRGFAFLYVQFFTYYDLCFIFRLHNVL